MNAATLAQAQARHTSRRWPIHALLTVQTAVVVLVTINRLGTLTLGYVLPNEFLRWVDFNNMLPLPLISVAAYYLLKRELEYDAPARDRLWHRALSLGFVLGVYLLGVGYGAHEVSNYLHARFCPGGTGSDLCRIVVYNDDEFSHDVFFLGFLTINGALLLLQAMFPSREPLSGRDIVLVALNGLLIAAGIVANLAFEAIGLDLYVVAAIAIAASALLWRRGAQPMFVYYSVAYVAGLIVTALIKGVMGVSA